MACKECEERRRKLRDAILRGKMAEAAGHAVAGAIEMLAPKAGATLPEGDYSTGGLLSDDTDAARLLGYRTPEAVIPASKPGTKRRK